MRQITDAQRQVTVPFPAWKRLMFWLIVACVVVGGSVGGYYIYNQVTSTLTQPTPPVQPSVVAPATSETPAQIEVPMPVLEVTWERIQLPPLKFGFDGIARFLVEDGGKTISVYRVIGPADGGEATLYSLWKTTDAGKTWGEVEQKVIYPEQEKEMGMSSPESGSISSSGSILDPLKPARHKDDKKEIVGQSVDPLTLYGDPPRMISRDENNIFVFVTYAPFEDLYKFFQESSDRLPLVYRLFLSTDSGNSWKQLNFPVVFSRFDAYPETPELTFLENKDIGEPGIRMIKVISSGDGSINIYIIIPGKGGFLRATIKSPN